MAGTMLARTFLVLVPAALLLAGCATDRSQYPSLARRPAERLSASFDAPPAPVEIIRPSPPPLVTDKLGGLVNAAEAANAKFGTREARARAVVGPAAGAKIGSESWATATIAVAELEAARAEAMLALSDIDMLYNDASVNGQEAQTIGAVRDKVIGLIARQDQVLAELRNRLGS